MNLPLSSLDKVDDICFNLPPAELPGAIAALNDEELQFLKKSLWAMRARCAQIEVLGRTK